jgi:DNA-binding winged helix-turn-helix (wHTH) protein
MGWNRAISKIREALGDSAENPRFVETVTRRGYRFLASVTVDGPTPIDSLEPTVQAHPADTQDRSDVTDEPAARGGLFFLQPGVLLYPSYCC